MIANPCLQFFLIHYTFNKKFYDHKIKIPLNFQYLNYKTNLKFIKN